MMAAQNGGRETKMGKTFREIDEQMLSLIGEDGEIMDREAFDALQMERDKKAENMALWVLDLKDEESAIRNEIGRLKEHLDSAERKEKRLKEYLKTVLEGEVLKTPTVSVSYRTTQAVEINDVEQVVNWAEKDERYESVLTYKEPEISKTELKKLLNEGVEVPGAAIVMNTSTIIK